MKTEEKKQYVKLRLETSRKTYEAAIVLIETGFSSSAVNRLYYSVFYAVNALLVNKGISVRTHSGIKQQFSLHFIKTKIINSEYGRLLAKLFDLRQKADYDNYFEIDIETVKSMLEPVKNMIDEIEKLVTN